MNARHLTRRTEQVLSPDETRAAIAARDAARAETDRHFEEMFEARYGDSGRTFVRQMSSTMREALDVPGADADRIARAERVEKIRNSGVRLSLPDLDAGLRR